MDRVSASNYAWAIRCCIAPRRAAPQAHEEVDHTHFHADFLAGHIELRNRAGARIVMGARAQPEFEFQPVKDGDQIELGDVHIQVLETPGHTPEGISLLVFDRTKNIGAGR